MLKGIISNEEKEINEIGKQIEQSYIEKIVDEASELSVECQEHVLDIMRGMVFTRKKVQKEIN
jgi:hypothetical protein